jgi:uroporphyrinogen decarboxylase
MSKLLISTLSKSGNQRSPIWVMRQAGRYLPEYRELRSNFPGFMEFCLTPDAAAEATIQPLKRFPLDAAIIFSDILIVPKALGVDVKFVEAEGPKLEKIENINDINKLNLEIGIFDKVCTAISKVRKEIDINYKDKTLIGFAGAPFTISAYMIEGSGSKDFMNVKKFMIKHRNEYSKLIDKIVDATITYLSMQIESGAEVIKIFDSWAGCLSDEDFKDWVIKPIERITTAIKSKYPNIPIIVFARGVGAKLKTISKKTSIDALAVDQYTDINWAFKNLNGKVIQGNLDNALLAFGERDQILKQAEKILKANRDSQLVFNLGHGILPETPIDNMKALVEYVVSYKNG